MDKIFEFNKQERRGKLGETLIIKAWPGLFEWSSDSRYDLIYLPENKKVEVKTEYKWTLENTPNFFMEEFSDDIKFKLGGPFRAQQDNIDIFISFFINNLVLFWFDDVDALVERCKEGIFKFKLQPKYIKNRGYNTIGYPIRRYWFENLYKQIELGGSL